jgi:hypothetical protein
MLMDANLSYFSKEFLTGIALKNEIYFPLQNCKFNK